LLFARPDDFHAYLEGLEESPEVIRESPPLMRAFYAFRGIVARVCKRQTGESMPHEGVYARIKPSPIHGVGVFAIKDVAAGTYLFKRDDAPIFWVDGKKIEELTGEVRRLYDDFCIIKGSMYGCPRNFNQLTMSWYLNESKEPNVGCDEDYDFYSLRDISKGEELTVDYSTFSEYPRA
jgi:hypothetical protein